MAAFLNRIKHIGRVRSSPISKRYRHLKTIQYLAIVLIVILVAFLAMYWLGNGFHLNDTIVSSSEDFYINIDQPASGSSFTQSNVFTVRGGSLGGTLSKVNIWDQAYNVGIPCNVVGTTFAVEIDAGSLSPGSHTLVAQAQATDGRWSQPASIDITITESISAPAPDYAETDGGLFPNVFQPIFDIVDGLSIQAEEGTGDNDLNGDNIDDRLQASPVSPRYNAFNLPLMTILIILIISIVVVFIVYYYVKYRQASQETRIKLTRALSDTPEKRKWYIQLQTLKPNKLSKKIRELRQLETKISSESDTLRKRQIALLKKEKEIQQERAANLSIGSLISRSIKQKADRIKQKERELLFKQKSFQKEAEVQNKLFTTQHQMAMENLRSQKIALQRQIYQAKQQNASDRSLQRISSKIHSIENRMSTMRMNYEKRLAEERAMRAQQQRTFGSILSKLRKEKEELSKQKSVKIFIGPSNKNKQPARRPYRPGRMQFIPRRRG